MSLKSLGAKITGKFAKQTFMLKESSPAILIGVGAVGVIATAVLASRATLKVSAALAEAEENLSKVDTDQDVVEIEKSVFSAQLRTAIIVAKHYAPAVIVGGLTVVAMTGAYKILHNRNAAISAAFAGTNAAFNRYRERVITDQGEGKDREYMYGGEEVEIVEEGPNGPETKIVHAVDVDAIRNGQGSPYVKIFEELNGNWSNLPGRNLDFITQQQYWANDLLISKGFLFLSDVYDMLGFEPSEASRTVGWVYNSENGDSHVSFGIWGNGVMQGKEWLVRGGKDPIVLDFNVDGQISHILKKF